MHKRFQKRTEDFTCAHCGTNVIGNGYTNHCTHCLWSRHVDINPGDRESVCGALMHPAEILADGEGYTVVHVCTDCGHIRKNKIASNDNMEQVITIASKT